jgi:hypothetical protein
MAVAQLTLFAAAESAPPRASMRAKHRTPTRPATPVSVTPRVQRGDLWQLGTYHRLLCGDSTNAGDMARLMDGVKAALVVADPPYGMGIDTWDKPLRDIPGWVGMIRQGMAANAFFALFQQMPTALEWLVALHAKGSGYRYRDHVVWVKRNLTAVALPLPRSHESLFVYSVGKARYHQTKGRYEDVKLPGVLVDVTTLDSIERHIKDVQTKLNGTYKPIRQDTLQHPVYNYFPRASDRSPELACYTNVWSFLPDRNKHKGAFSMPHATTKPILLLERLVALCTPDGAPVLDPFLGSGTTLIACEHTGRACYGCEIDPGYCDTAIARWEHTTGQRAMLLTR